MSVISQTHAIQLLESSIPQRQSFPNLRMTIVLNFEQHISQTTYCQQLGYGAFSG